MTIITLERRKEICEKIWETRRYRYGKTGRKNDDHYKDPEYRKKLSNSLMGHPVSEETKKKLSNTIKEKWISNKLEDIIYREKQLTRLKSQKFRKFMSDTRKKQNADPNSIYNSIEYKEKVRKRSSKQWENEEFVKKILYCQHKLPNSYEKKIINICKKYNHPFEFTGDGSKLIGRLKSDFTSTNNDKLLIETFHEYWHESDYRVNRDIKLYDLGYRVLFLSQYDIERVDWENHCKIKIERFLHFFSSEKKWKNIKYFRGFPNNLCQ